MTAAPRIGHEDVQRLSDAGAQILDALPAEDYRKQRVPGAINVPLERFSRDLLQGLDPTRATITYCADNQCDLSARLAARLLYEGFAEVYEYAASIADWTAFGLPIEGEEAQIARAGNLARRDLPTSSSDERAESLLERMGEHPLCAVVDGEGVLLGRILRSDIEPGCQAAASEIMHPGPSTFRPDVPLSDMEDWFAKRPDVDAFIISTPDGRPFGALLRADLARITAHARRNKNGKSRISDASQRL